MMKFLYSLIALLFFSLSLSGQQSSKSKLQPININSSVIIDNIYNIDGGIKPGFTTLGLFDFSIDYSPQTKGLLRNTSFYAHLLKTAGKGASENLIGDVQVSSNIEGMASRFIYELYISQQLKSFNLSFGLHDLNTEFMVSEYAGDFINSSFGIFPAVSLNVPVSIFPVTSVGGVVAYRKKSFDIVAGLYNLNYDYVYEEVFNIQNHLFNKGFLGVLEMRYKINPPNGLSGEYKIGGYYKDCQHLEDQHKDESCFTEENHGIYFIADQLIWSSPNDNKLGMFAQIGIAPKETNYVPYYYGFGISLKTRDKKYIPDVIGLAVGSVGLNSFDEGDMVFATSNETTIELNIQKELSGRISLQPDFQYIINPAGILNNAFAGILRLNIKLNN